MFFLNWLFFSKILIIWILPSQSFILLTQLRLFWVRYIMFLEASFFAQILHIFQRDFYLLIWVQIFDYASNTILNIFKILTVFRPSIVGALGAIFWYQIQLLWFFKIDDKVAWSERESTFYICSFKMFNFN